MQERKSGKMATSRLETRVERRELEILLPPSASKTTQETQTQERQRRNLKKSFGRLWCYGVESARRRSKDDRTGQSRRGRQERRGVLGSNVFRQNVENVFGLSSPDLDRLHVQIVNCPTCVSCCILIQNPS